MIQVFFRRIQRILQLRWHALSEDSRDFFSRLRLPFFLLVTVTLLGTFGYTHFWQGRGGTWLDGLFMTLITITTIGYGEVLPLSNSERLFTMAIAISGIGSLSYIFATSTEFIVARQLSNARNQRRMERMISELSEHIIVAGYGRMGRWVVHELIEQKEKFVIIDLGDWQDEPYNSYLHISGDASDDTILQQAGIERARSLIAVTANDATNAFVVMSARALNPDICIIARSESDGAIHKLRRAGANNVINPYAFGGQRLVQHILYPAVMGLMQHATKWSDELTIQEYVISPNSPFGNKTLRELDLRAKYNINVVAVLRHAAPAPYASVNGIHKAVREDNVAKDRLKNHELIIPTGNDTIRPEDILIVIAEQYHIAKFEALLIH